MSTTKNSLKRWIGDGSKRVYFENGTETEDDILESFQELVDAGTFPEENYLLFKIKLKHHKRKGEEKLYLTCGDDETFESVLDFVAPHIDAKAETTVFMTDDSFGIRPAQSAGNVFMKYGNDFEIHTGVHLNQIGWHAKN